MKNLIIFDRIVEEKIFLEEMSKLHLPCFDNYKEKNPKYSKLDLNYIFKLLYTILVKQINVFVNIFY